MMTRPIDPIIKAIIEAVILSLVVACVPLVTYLDVHYLGSIPEVSITEFAQEGMMVLVIILMALSIHRNRESAGFRILMAGFFLCVLIRELDYLSDMIAHGAWKWIAVPTAAVAIVLARRFPGTVLAPMRDYVGSKAYFLMLFGLVTLLVFSRLFGSGMAFLNHVLEVKASSLAKNVIQEGMELYGYIFIFYASLLYLKPAPKQLSDTAPIAALATDEQDKEPGR